MRTRVKLKKYFARNPKKYYKTSPIRPRSLIAVRKDNPGTYSRLLDKKLRVGYYSKQDGLNVIWIVYPSGEYGESTTHAQLNLHFEVVVASDESDLYGDNRPILQPLSQEEMRNP